MKKIIMTIAVLAVAGMAADASQLVTGKSDGVNTFDSVGYGWGSGWQFADAVVDIEVVGNDVFTVGARGLGHMTYDPVTDTLSPIVHTVWHDATGLAVMQDGTIITTQSGGMNAWSWDGSAFTELTYYGGFNARDVAVDSNGKLHVAQSDGVSAWTWNGSALSQDYYLGGAYSGGSAIYVGDDDIVRYGKGDGINSLTWDGSTYTDIGYSASGGKPVNDILITDDGMWFAHDGGVHLHDAAAPGTYLGHFGDAANYALAVDADGQLHAGKHDGILEWNYTSGVGVSTGDYFHWGTGIQALAAIPEPATLGLFGLIGGGMLWIRRRFMI